jgi:integrase
MQVQRQQQQEEDTRVNIFLQSIGRGSNNSKRLYNTSLNHFTQFLKSTKNLTPDSIIPSLTEGKMNVYELLDQFFSYLSNQRVNPLSLKVYVSVVRSFLEYSDVDIVPSKFRRKVKVPRFYPDQEETLTLTDIRTLLEYNSNHRLRTYILLLFSTGLRAVEAASLRLQDVDFTTNPTRITIGRQNSKTKRGRIIYCSDEATTHLKKLIEMYPYKKLTDFIFAGKPHTKHPMSIYRRILEEFQKVQHIAEKDARKENSKRRKFTLHSFRRTCFSIINENTNSEFAHYYLGHSNSPYWTHKESERRNIYLTKCMPFLTIYQDSRSITLEEALQEERRNNKLLTNRITDIELHQKEMSEILQNLTPELLKRIKES